MCLSTVYRDGVKQDNMVMKNVRMIEYQNGNIVLTDLMERQMSIEGELVMANLVDGVAVIRENNFRTGGRSQIPARTTRCATYLLRRYPAAIPSNISAICSPASSASSIHSARETGTRPFPSEPAICIKSFCSP